jgi:2-keto-4-pentenoate hydratase/2-oxohepta-3-ene-1,7-dioic acid hydratase in catechol pathway
MRWVTYVSPQDGSERAGVLGQDGVSGGPAGTSLADLLARGTEGLAAAGRTLLDQPSEFVPLAQADLRAPIPVPPSIRDFMAFENHAVTAIEAIGGKLSPVWYQIPVFYFTNPAAVRGPREAVPVAPGSDAFDYELEVAAVIGAPGENISVEDADQHIAGFMLLCDWSARDLQEHEMAIGLGPAKGKDTATSFGPWLITPDELADVRTERGYDLAMTADVNGKRYSAGNWSTLYWTFAQMIAYASRGTVLRPGDVIGSGTVGTGCVLELSRVHGADAYPWLRPGDRVTLAVDRLGTIDAAILPAATPTPLSLAAGLRRDGGSASIF